MSKYISKGSYGCIIQPNLNCNGSFGDTNEISKFFFDKDDYIIEKKLQVKVDKIDKKKEFTIKKISDCKVKLTPEIKKKIKNLDLCELDEDKDIYQITFEYGGIDLHRIFKYNLEDLNNINLFIFLQKFSNIFEGLCKINENNFVHFDIRIDNILYDIEKNKFNIIDFGLMTGKNKIYQYETIYSFKDHLYPYYPSDFNILSYIYNGIFYKDLKKYNLNTNFFIIYIDNYMNNIILKYKSSKDPYFKKILKEFIQIFNYFDNDMFKKFDSNFFEKIFLKKINIKKICADIGGKTDVYMLGLVLFELLINIFRKLDKNPSIKKIPIKLFSLIRKMILLNPCERISIQDATKEFKSIMMLKQV